MMHPSLSEIQLQCEREMNLEDVQDYITLELHYTKENHQAYIQTYTQFSSSDLLFKACRNIKMAKFEAPGPSATSLSDTWPE